MKKSRWLIRVAVSMLWACLVFPVYAQKVTDDGAFSFERLSDMEKRIAEESAAASKTSVVENATTGTSEAAVEVTTPVLAPKAFSSSRSFNMWRSLGALLIVLGGLIVANKWLQGRFAGRRNLMGATDDRQMRVVERLTVDHRKQLVLVSVGNRELVLAVTPTDLRAVAQWNAGDVAEEQEGVNA